MTSGWKSAEKSYLKIPLLIRTIIGWILAGFIAFLIYLLSNSFIGFKFKDLEDASGAFKVQIFIDLLIFIWLIVITLYLLFAKKTRHRSKNA